MPTTEEITAVEMIENLMINLNEEIKYLIKKVLFLSLNKMIN